MSTYAQYEADPTQKIGISSREKFNRWRRGVVRHYETVKSTKGSIGIVFGSAGEPDARHRENLH
jgi:hypothetical protein